MFEHYEGPPKLRSWAEIEARVMAHHQQERVKAEAFLRAQRAVKWLGALAVVLILLLLYVCSNFPPTPAAPVCPANVMELDPLTIRANGAPVVEI